MTPDEKFERGVNIAKVAEMAARMNCLFPSPPPFSLILVGKMAADDHVVVAPVGTEGREVVQRGRWIGNELDKSLAFLISVIVSIPAWVLHLSSHQTSSKFANQQLF